MQYVSIPHSFSLSALSFWKHKFTFFYHINEMKPSAKADFITEPCVCVCVCWAVNQSHKSNSSLWTGVCSSARVHSAFLLFCLAEGKLFLVMEFEKRSRTTETRHMITETWTLLLFLTAASVQCCFITLPMMQHCYYQLHAKQLMCFWKALQMDSNSSFGPSFTSHFEVFLNSFAKH